MFYYNQVSVRCYKYIVLYKMTYFCPIVTRLEFLDTIK